MGAKQNIFLIYYSLRAPAFLFFFFWRLLSRSRAAEKDLLFMHVPKTVQLNKNTKTLIGPQTLKTRKGTQISSQDLFCWIIVNH